MTRGCVRFNVIGTRYVGVMAKKLSRNGPCHCGSGIKYKKCCLPVDEAANPGADEPVWPAVVLRGSTRVASRKEQWKEVMAEIAERHGSSSPRRVPQDETDALLASEELLDDDLSSISPDIAFWTQFQRGARSGDIDEKLAWSRRAMVEVQRFDEEWAFDVVSVVAPGLRWEGRWQECDALIDELIASHPEAAAEEADYLDLNRLLNALTGSNHSDLSGPILRMAERVEDDIYEFKDALQVLLYHGHVALVLRACELAWPRVLEDDEMILDPDLPHFALMSALAILLDSDEPWNGERFDGYLATFSCDHLEQEPWQEIVERYVTGVPGVIGRARFDSAASSRERHEDYRWLVLQFSRDLHTRWQWTRGKAILADQYLMRFITERESFKEPAARLAPRWRGKRSGKAARKARLAKAMKPANQPDWPLDDRYVYELLGTPTQVDRYVGFGHGWTEDGHGWLAFAEALPLWIDRLEEYEILAPLDARVVRATLLNILDEFTAALRQKRGSEPMVFVALTGVVLRLRKRVGSAEMGETGETGETGDEDDRGEDTPAGE